MPKVSTMSQNIRTWDHVMKLIQGRRNMVHHHTAYAVRNSTTTRWVMMAISLEGFKEGLDKFTEVENGPVNC